MTLIAAFIQATSDPARDAVLPMLTSYAGLSIGVAVLISGLKALWKGWVENKEPVLAIILTFALGIASKIIFMEVYGPHTVKSWTLHMIILVFVAIGGQLFHDKIINPIVRKPDPK
jgi:hypothetical protein